MRFKLIYKVSNEKGPPDHTNTLNHYIPNKQHEVNEFVFDTHIHIH